MITQTMWQSIALYTRRDNGSIPTPGAGVIQYKPPGKEEYMDMKELFDDI